MKKGVFLLCLAICILFTLSSVCASDVNDTAIASEDTGEIELSHEIESADDNLGTIEEQTVTQTDNEEKTGETDDGTFEALNMKIGDVSSGNTVYLENNYSCEDSWTQENGIEIYKSNLIIDGQGHTIDAKQKTRIFHVYNAENVTIKNIKFINAKINGNDGGAIKWSDGANSIISGCSFVNCSVNKYGGAICWDNIYGVHVSACSFVNCFANDYGGAIYWDLSSNGNISDCVFINNADSNGKAIYIDGFASLNCNWFGNTAENYKTSPNAYIYGAGLGNWLFLNATVESNPISIAETADIIFKLYLYDGSITDYTSLAKVDLTLNSNGKLDKNVTGLDEKVKFTPTSPGTGSITATIGDVAYTTTLTVTDGTTFWDLNKIINGNTNDTITLDRDYAYNPNSDSTFTNGIRITRPVTINGNGHTIDAKGKKSVFYVNANNVTIKNLTIKNVHMAGYGGAIYLGMVDGCIVSQCNFINNTAKYGGAICGEGPENSVISQCTFINNSAEYGGAIYWDSQSGNAYNCVFLNNNGNKGSAIYIVPYSYLTADYCWFGNTATDYDGDLPISGSCTNWMFLNATANPDAIAVSETSDIIFKLYLYNSTSGNITEYDNAPFENLNLTIASTNGNVSKNIAKLGEIIKYNATNIGTGSVTASIENVTYTIELNIKYRPDLSVQSQEVGYSSNTVITLVYNSTATGTVNITLKGKNRNYTFEKELNATISLGNIDADEYEVNVTYSGDNVFENATATGKLTINKANSTLTINDNVTFDYNTNGSTTVSYTNATGVNASVVGQPNATVVVNDTTITVSGLDAGNYTLSVTTITDENHNNVTKTANITVNKIDSTLSVSDVTLDYGTSTSVAVTTEGATGITAKINDKEAVVENNTIVIPVLDAGTYTLTVTTIPDDNHNAVTKTATITVNKVDSILTVNDVVFDYGSSGTTTISYAGATGVTATVNNAKAVVNVNGNVVTVSGLDGGTYTLSVTTIPDDNHNAVTKTATITVNNAPDDKNTTPSQPDTTPSQNTNKNTATKKTTKTTLTLKKVKVKKSAKKLVITATLKINKKAVKGKTIKFKFNKKTYKAKTNKKGVAKITIKKVVLKKLKVGKKITYSATYGKVTKKVTVKVKK